MFRIYSTLSDKKELLPESRPLKFFVCGPTVYDDIHIGNGRTSIAFDIIARYLRSRDVEVFYLQNITDVDDKIIARAKEEGVAWDKIARDYEEAYYAVLKALGADAVTEFARATGHIPEIVKQVETLIAKGNVYKIEGDGWYFDLTTFPEYGKLARRTVEQAEDGVSRIDESDKKRNRGDFCVWKFSKPGEPVWETALGAGRPGWHIEDTAITEHYFGPQYDIHGGGIDIKFPHHEAEIAQQESASGLKPFVKIWMHAGLILMDGAKMSKSKGNFITMKDLLGKYPAETFRMAVLQQHYRSPMDWTDDLALQARKNLQSMAAFTSKLVLLNGKGGAKALDAGAYRARFHAAMEDDFNTPQALAVLFELMNDANQDIWGLSAASATEAILFMNESLASLGLVLQEPEIPEEVRAIAEAREEARRNKQFVHADELRGKILGLGYSLEDTPVGPLLLPKESGI